MIDIDLILYKINTSFHYLVNSFNDLFITKTPEDNGYTIITKNRIKYVTYEELWEEVEKFYLKLNEEDKILDIEIKIKNKLELIKDFC